MKKYIFLAGGIMLFSCLFIGMASCSGHHEHPSATEAHQHEGDAYQCPMQCEGDKTYSEPGKCPKCNMDLVKLEG